MQNNYVSISQTVKRLATRTPVNINDIYNDTLKRGIRARRVKAIWISFTLENYNFLSNTISKI